MIYVVSDLSGCYNSWKKMLETVCFSDEDEMYVLGNVLDKGKYPIRLLKDLAQRANVYPVMGSAEYRFLSFMRDVPADVGMNNFREYLKPDRMAEFAVWINEGGRTSFEQYLALSPDDREGVLDYLDEFTFYETVKTRAGRFVLTHSGFSDFDEKKPLSDYTPEQLLFNESAPYQTYFSDKTVIYGHIPTLDVIDGEPGKIFRSATGADINAGVIRHKDGGTLACLRLDDMKEFYL